MAVGERGGAGDCEEGFSLSALLRFVQGGGREHLNQDQHKWVRGDTKDSTALQDIVNQVKPTMSVRRSHTCLAATSSPHEADPFALSPLLQSHRSERSGWSVHRACGEGHEEVLRAADHPRSVQPDLQYGVYSGGGVQSA